MVVLGIETSCDETGCGLVDENYRVLGESLYTQAATHAKFGGVVPEIAARAHLEKIQAVVEAALEDSGLSLDAIDVIAHTRGPGLLGPLLVGSSFAQGLARALGKPVMGLNHLEGHLASAYLTDPAFEPPFVALLVSGGHTELLHVGPNLEFTVLGATRDDAAGEAFDKSGKLLGLGYPAGAEVGRLAAEGRRDFLPLPRALMERGNLEFSFSGLKTAVAREAQKRGADTLLAERADFCASLETAIADVLVKKTLWAMRQRDETKLILGGGVAANAYLRERMTEMARREGFRLVLPERRFCGDNGVMMAAAAQKRIQLGRWPQTGVVTAGLRWE
ncbi:MAG: metalloendopeptidase glycoprotease family [Fibrobacteria bacterium]|jgi:N6-L-threonylcarbamoyladenine synthase|nr:metalloendopeptidase glycoprotease family [Fibrobacteria bacterium]